METFFLARYSPNYVQMSFRVNRQLLNSRWDEQASRVRAQDLHLQHIVHESDPIIQPSDFSFSTVDRTTFHTSEHAAVMIAPEFQFFVKISR